MVPIATAMIMITIGNIDPSQIQRMNLIAKWMIFLLPILQHATRGQHISSRAIPILGWLLLFSISKYIIPSGTA
jgi:hypothetical protein